ncbi:unnamed protein product [Porites evermanni]|uniref:Uncharacterized protein n=1 Tax=Porites evermanni TaxID=104178 RepID=A0ABN8MA81_9CNID|nr:unnamed protein product [Porites evermanni]
METRDRLHYRCLLSRDPVDWSNYNESRNTVKGPVSQALAHHKTRHSYTKDLKVVADEFNVFFSSVGRNAAHAAACLSEENKITLAEPPFDSHIPASEELFNLKPMTFGDV